MEQIKTTSIRYLLQQVQSRFKINNSNWRADALDSVGLIIGEIGYHTGYAPSLVRIDIENYKAKIPKHVVSIGTIYYNGVPLVEAKQRDSYYRNYKDTEGRHIPYSSPEDVLALEKEMKRLKEVQVINDANPTEETLLAVSNSISNISKILGAVRWDNNHKCFENWFRIEAGYIKTSLPAGCLEVDADCFMIDEFGYGMVVDTFKYTEACIWGMLYYLMLGGYIHPVLTLAYVEGKKDEFVLQAKNEPKIMSIERQQEFAETWSTINSGVDLGDALNYR